MAIIWYGKKVYLLFNKKMLFIDFCTVLTLNKIRINTKAFFSQQQYLWAVEQWTLRLKGDGCGCCSVWRRTIFSQLHIVGFCLGPCRWWNFSICQLVLKKVLILEAGCTVAFRYWDNIWLTALFSPPNMD